MTQPAPESSEPGALPPGDRALRALSFIGCDPSVGTGIKVCGFTRSENVEAVLDAAPAVGALGFNFWPRSKRYLPLEAASEWLPRYAGRVTRVGLFVNAADEEIERAFEGGLIDAAQLHGDEDPLAVANWLEQGYAVFKACGVKDRASLDAATEFPGSLMLLDAPAAERYGGTGKTFDWRLASQAVQSWPDRRVVLAGGLRPENVAEALVAVRPYAVDVASGVESAPGIKDPALVKAFVRGVAESEEAEA